MRIHLVFLCCLFAWACSKKMTKQSSKLSEEVKELSQKIAEKNMLSGKYIGRGGSTSAQYMLFEDLMEKADEKSLILLTDHESPVVRSYAFWALAKQNSSDVPKILEKHLNDDIIIRAVFGDVVNEVSVADFMMELVAKDDIDPDCMKLKPQQIEKIKNLKKN